MSITLLLILYVLVILTAVFLFNFRWIIQQIRQISNQGNKGGYTKLIQISLMGFLCIIFFSVVIYYFKFPSKVDKVDVILTVVVGWLGLVIGGFFGDKSMDDLRKEKEQQGVKRADLLIARYEHVLDKLKQKLENKSNASEEK